MSNKPLISIIIPCYNSGEFLTDAINSIDKTDDLTLNIIIVDDGSTDVYTLDLLVKLKEQEITVIHQKNKGPAAARNTGVKASNSKYLLFLDSDNKIRPTYIPKAINILESDEKIGVVYGVPNFFGESEETRFIPLEFNMNTILRNNYIDVCAVIRREVWENVCGFDENSLLIGREDWDFWIKVGVAGWGFHFVQETLYDYRIRKDSIIAQASMNNSLEKALTYLYLKHKEIFLMTYDDLYQTKLKYESEHKNPFYLFIKYFYHKYLMKR